MTLPTENQARGEAPTVAQLQQTVETALDSLRDWADEIRKEREAWAGMKITDWPPDAALADLEQAEDGLVISFEEAERERDTWEGIASGRLTRAENAERRVAELEAALRVMMALPAEARREMKRVGREALTEDGGGA